MYGGEKCESVRESAKIIYKNLKKMNESVRESVRVRENTYTSIYTTKFVYIVASHLKILTSV